MKKSRKQVNKYDRYVYNFRRYYFEMLSRREIGRNNYRKMLEEIREGMV